MTPKSRVLIGGGILAVALGTGATTYSLWDAGTFADGALIRSGDLDISLVDGTFAWAETSPDVADARSGTDPASLAAFVAMSGDSFVITQDVATELEGDNILGALTVSWGNGPALPGGFTASYEVLGDDGASVGQAALGTPVTIEAPAGTDTWTVQISVDIDRDRPDRYTNFTGPDPEETAGLGTIVIDLDQVRTGTGFTS